MAMWREELHPRVGGKFAPKGTASRMAEVHVGREAHPGMSDHQFNARAKRVEQVMDIHGPVVQNLSTHVTHTDAHGHWLPERNDLHKEIAQHLYEKHGAHVPNEGKAIISGGLGGAGKTTVLKKHMGIDTDKHYLSINPDDIKEELARRGHVPEVPGHPDLSPMERAALVHEESSRIAGMIAQKAYQDKKNVMWDITMSSHKCVQNRIDDLNNHGYTHTHGVFVHIPAEVSVQRAMGRYRRGQDKFDKGDGHGGRFVPPSIIRAQATPNGSTINRETFEGMRHQFHHSTVYDNAVDGRDPVKISDKTHHH